MVSAHWELELVEVAIAIRIRVLRCALNFDMHVAQQPDRAMDISWRASASAIGA